MVEVIDLAFDFKRFGPFACVLFYFILTDLRAEEHSGRGLLFLFQQKKMENRDSQTTFLHYGGQRMIMTQPVGISISPLLSCPMEGVPFLPEQQLFPFLKAKPF